jgi:Spy/CpxP family protein refolding chaperone
MKTAAKTFATALAVVVAISCSSIQVSAFMGDDGAPIAGHQFKKMATELGLSARQQEEIKTIYTKHRPTAEPLMKQLQGEHRVLKELIQADVIDEPAIRAQVAKTSLLQSDLAVQHAKIALEVRAILTPEQNKKYKARQTRHEGRMNGKRMHDGKQSKDDM